MAVSCLLLLTGCTSIIGKNSTNKVVQKTSTKGTKTTQQSVTVIPKTNDTPYQTIVPKNTSSTRGYIQYGVDNRADINEIETGLMRLSKAHFNPDTYVFQSGTYIKPNLIETLLSRKSKNPQGLNPALPKPLSKLNDAQKIAMSEKYPRTLSYILEQDYLVKSGKNYRLGGVSLAISMNQVYNERIQVSGGKFDWATKNLNVSKVKNIAKTDAADIVQKVRQVKGLGNVPIFVTLYMEAPPGSITPGYYFAETMVNGNNSTIGKWTPLKEETVLFPSNEATTKYTGDSDNFDKFKSDVQSYFPTFVGVVGQGFYKDGHLTNLKISIPLKFYDETEIIGFTQYLTMLLNTKFPFSKSIPVEIDISSVDQPEALIVRTPSMDTPFVHVYK